MKKIFLTKEITVVALDDDKKTETPIQSTQSVSIEEEENGETWTNLMHDGTEFSMSLTNLFSMHSLIDSAIVQYFNDKKV